MTRKTRLTDIDSAKGFAIFLVVLGHIVAQQTPIGNEWYAILKTFIYKFHMPFFMFISGLIMVYTYKNIATFKEYKAYILNKIIRLAPAFLLFALIIYAGKVITSKFFFVDDIPGSFIDELFFIFVIPSQSAGGSLWFIYTLLQMYIIFPIFIILFKQKPLLILLFGIILYFTPVTSYFLLDRFFEYFIFFALGAYAVWNYDKYLTLIDRYFIAWIILFFSSFLLINLVDPNVSKLIIGLLALPSIHGLIRQEWFKLSIWDLFGKYTFSIYLMNTIFIGFTKAVIFLFVIWHGYNFYWIAPILLISGLYGPIFIKKYILVKIKPLNNITN